MSDYAELLDNHITKENNILFRMADNVLSDAEQKNLLKEFESIEQNRAAGTGVIDYIDRINALALIYKV
jgi:hemerythrin-like domain-containing protein